MMSDSKLVELLKEAKEELRSKSIQPGTSRAFAHQHVMEAIHWLMSDDLKVKYEQLKRDNHRQLEDFISIENKHLELEKELDQPKTLPMLRSDYLPLTLDDCVSLALKAVQKDVVSVDQLWNLLDSLGVANSYNVAVQVKNELLNKYLITYDGFWMKYRQDYWNQPVKLMSTGSQNPVTRAMIKDMLLAQLKSRPLDSDQMKAYVRSMNVYHVQSLVNEISWYLVEEEICHWNKKWQLELKNVSF